MNAVVPAADLDTEVRRWADELLSMSPTVLKLLKMSFDEEYAPMRDYQEKDYLPIVKPDFFASGEQAEGPALSSRSAARISTSGAEH